MPRRELFLLGLCRANLDEESQPGLTSPKYWSLLAYLALEPPDPHPRARVAILLWPERDSTRASHNLRQTIYRLNKLLALPDLPDALLVTRHTLALNPAADLWVDAAHLQQTLRETAVHTHERLARCPACLQRLEKAVAHVRGPLLDGVDPDSEPFEEWLRPRRNRLQQQALAALGRLAAAHQEQGAYRRAQAFANRQIELAPWHERAYRRLARALAAQGRRAEALAQFEQMEVALRDHLNVAPAQASLDLAAAIRSGARTPRRSPRRLPPQHTPFIGRAAEMAAIAARLQDPTCRLLTLVGPGGVGKSRLAIEAARAFSAALPHDATFVPLAGVPAANVAAAILAALHIPLLNRDRDGLQLQLRRALREREALLILDDYEHLLPQTGLVQQILQEAPGVRLLVTSRQRLALSAEWVLDIAGLPTTASGAQPSDAVALFAALAARVDARFKLASARPQSPDPPSEAGAPEADRPLVAHVCRLLDGLPLALELAAALVRDWSVRDIRDAVTRNLDALQTAMPDVEPRHRGLRAVFDHSWTLLREEEKEALSRLAIFRGPFTPAAANAVFGSGSVFGHVEDAADLLEALTNRSLLQEAGDRYRLHATLHQYALEKLQARPALARAAAAAHSAHYLNLLQQADPSGAAIEDVAAVEDVSAAWRHAFEQPATLLPALPGLERLYLRAGYLQEGHALLADTAARLAQGEPPAAWPALRAHLAARKLEFIYRLARYDDLRREAHDALRLGEAAGEQAVVARAHFYLGAALARRGAYREAGQQIDATCAVAQREGLAFLQADALRLGGQVAVRLGDYAAAERRYEASLHIARRAGYGSGEGHALGGLGNVALVQEAPLLARERYRAALQLLGDGKQPVAARENPAGGDELAAATVRENLATTYWAVGRYLHAAAVYRQNLDVRRRVGDRRGEGASLLRLAIQDHYCGDLERARDGYLAALNIFQDIGYRRGEGESLAHLCLLHHHQGQDARALDLGRQAEAIARANHDRSDLAYALTFSGHAAAALGNRAAALAAYEEALALRQEIGENNRALEPRAGLAELDLAAGHTEKALVHAEAILAHLQRDDPDHVGLDLVDEPARVYLAAVRVLSAANDRRAAGLLQQARDFLRRRGAYLDHRADAFFQLPPNAALLAR